MGNFYQRLAFIVILVVGISGAVIYFTLDIHTLRHLTAFRPWSLVLVAVLMAVGMYFDGTRLLHLVDIAGQRITLLQAVQVIFSNYFLALLTPGAAGGAVAQVVFLRRAGVPTGIATVVVLIRTLMSLLFLFVCLPVVFYYDPGLLPWIPPQVLVVASVLIIVICGALVWFLRSSASVKLLVALTKRIKPTRRKRVFTLYRDTRGAVFLLLAAPLSMLRVFAESAASLLALYSIVPVLFLGLGISVDWPLVLGRMIFLNILLYFAPTPGGSGIAEGGFVILFNELLPPGTVGVLAVAWRIVAEYLPFSIGLYFAVKIFGRDFLLNQLNRGPK
ncbi:MAG: lysylphosphatidylglycerol synthase transmembrane domain-containing protein [Negativicutes bacterium]|nr:lysylphosphatidylglycerol synthase transmembrane domain-containing protein [Negativicutes bacterium]